MCDCLVCARAALGPVSLAAHTIVKQVIDFAMAIFGCFSTVAQSLVATCLGKVGLWQGTLAAYMLISPQLVPISCITKSCCEAACLG